MVARAHGRGPPFPRVVARGRDGAVSAILCVARCTRARMWGQARHRSGKPLCVVVCKKWAKLPPVVALSCSFVVLN